MPTRKKPKSGEPRAAATYRGARRPEMIKLAKQRRRELLEREAKQARSKPPQNDTYSRKREAARRRRQMAAGQLQR